MIEEYKFGSITIDGKTYHHDVEIRWTGEVLPWQRKISHLIEENDVLRAVGEKPETIMIGSGESGMARITDSVQRLIKEKGIKLIIDTTEEAVKTFNVIAEKSELENGVPARVIALLHLTC